jgi:hypothetical protein
MKQVFQLLKVKEKNIRGKIRLTKLTKKNISKN